MKKMIFLTILGLFPLMAGAHSLRELSPTQIPLPSIPTKFTSSSETAVMEWGCPVSEVVRAKSSAEAVEKIGKECILEAKRAANSKPGVFEVIETSVIWPDIAVSEVPNGFHLNGTFFLETLVLQGAQRK